MKKLMFAIAAAVLAVGAQANNVNWSLQLNAVAKTGDTSIYTAYFFDKATFDAGVTGTTIEQSLLSSALDSSSFYLKSSGSSTDTYITGQSASSTGIREITGLPGTAMDYYMVLVDSTNNKYAIAVEGNTTPTDPMAAASPIGKSTTWAKMQGTASSGNLSWGTVSGGAVPEPTSGILMLVGLGALALRRRKA